MKTMIFSWHVRVTLASCFFALFSEFKIIKLVSGISHSWSVKIESNKNATVEHLDFLASEIATEIGAENLGQIGELKGYYLFKLEKDDFIQTERLILGHGGIKWRKKELLLRRVKRRPPPRIPDFPQSDNLLVFYDPYYPLQWHLHNTYSHRLDCNVTGVWALNITGRGSVVAIVDDGVEWRHPDLIDNYCKEGSVDLNSDDDDPTPSYDKEEENKHGTRCAGEVAAQRNSICGVGIAFNSKFSGIRVLDGPTTDATEATAFNKYLDVNDIFSCSWGPEDDGKSVDGPHSLGKMALQHGVVAGRKGFGALYVVASGNGGEHYDNCNYDGYANSIYTVTIGAVDEYGRIPPYAEECASMIACSVSSGTSGARSIVTTDWSLPPGNARDQCTERHTGTSAATPLAAGMIALMLEARPCLTWRDVQHIIVMTAVWIDHATAWTRNKAGFRHSDIHGFGLMDSWRLVNAAKIWESVPWLTSFSPDTSGDSKVEIPCCYTKGLILGVDVTENDCDNNMLATLEHITFHVKLDHFNRGRLKISLVCPSGTESIIRPRSKDISDEGLNWTFSTVKCWGEKPFGAYVLKILDTSKHVPSDAALGVLKEWSLTIYGSSWTSKDISKRRNHVRSSYSGEYLRNNFTLECPVGQPLEFDVTSAISDSTIKLVTMLSCFLAFWAIYYVFEIAFCDPEEKDKPSNATETSNSQGSITIAENDTVFYNGTFSGNTEEVSELVMKNENESNG